MIKNLLIVLLITLHCTVAENIGNEGTEGEYDIEYTDLNLDIGYTNSAEENQKVDPKDLDRLLKKGRYSEKEIKTLNRYCKTQIRKTYNGLTANEYKASRCFEYGFANFILENVKEGYGKDYYVYLYTQTSKKKILSPRKYCSTFPWYKPIKHQGGPKGNWAHLESIGDCYKSLGSVGLYTGSILGRSATEAFRIIYLFLTFSMFPVGSYAYSYYKSVLDKVEFKNDQTLDPDPYCDQVTSELPRNKS